jgi:hypothetical protein
MRKTIAAVVLAASVVLGVPAAAYAAGPCQSVTQTGGNNYGLLNGLQVAVPVSAGLDFVGNAFGLLGSASTTGATSTTSC